MKYNSDKHHRHSIRLKHYDYSAEGFYFVTLCTHQREYLFGEIVDGEMRLNQLGQIAAEEWMRSPSIRQEIELDEWVVMPNHIHGIVIINSSNKPISPVGANGHSLQRLIPEPTSQNSVMPLMKPKSLSSLIVGFKSVTAKRINVIRDSPGNPIWQRNYYEHIIRNDRSLATIRRYIQNNPKAWEQDQLHSDNSSKW